MATSFAQSDMRAGLLDAAVSEVLRRMPKYFARFPARISSLPRLLKRYQNLPLFCDTSDSEIMVQLQQSVRELAHRGVIFTRDQRDTDKVTHVLLDTAMDAFAASNGLLALTPPPIKIPPIPVVLAEAFDERALPSGGRYFIRRGGTHALILINAVGLSCALWARFLADSSHPFRIIIVESRSTDLIRGGMRQYVDLRSDAQDIAQVIERESIVDPAVLSWCNGVRVALELVSKHNAGIRFLILLCPTMMGFKGFEHSCSQFEESLDYVFRAVIERPALASFFAQTLKHPEGTDIDNVAEDPLRRSDFLFRLPAHEHIRDLFAPMSDGASLLNYARRGVSDKVFQLERAIRELRIPVLWVTGASDEIVNNRLTMAAFETWQLPTTHMEVSGAGHYIQDLQYPYFMLAIERWLLKLRDLPETTPVRASDFGPEIALI
jgi:pimeloyl-ACP methyl ester carboxylesterase